MIKRNWPWLLALVLLFLFWFFFCSRTFIDRCSFSFVGTLWFAQEKGKQEEIPALTNELETHYEKAV